MEIAARRCGLTTEELEGVLAGDTVPNWPVVEALIDAYRGCAGEFQVLWQQAQGVDGLTAWQSLDTAACRLRDTLRGLHLAAGSPPSGQLSAECGVPAKLVAAALQGTRVPDWATTMAIARALGASPLTVRPVWQEVHYAYLISPKAFPAGGLERDIDPAAPLRL